MALVITPVLKINSGDTVETSIWMLYTDRLKPGVTLERWLHGAPLLALSKKAVIRTADSAAASGGIRLPFSGALSADGRIRH